MQKKKIVPFAVLTLIILVFTAYIFAYDLRVNAGRCREGAVNSEDILGKVELVKGKAVEQTFRYTEKIMTMIQLYLNPAAEGNRSVDVALYDAEGTLIQKWQVTNEEIRELKERGESYYSFWLDSPLTDTAGRDYRIEIESDGEAGAGDTIVANASEYDAYGRGVCRVGGKTQPFDLNFTALGDNYAFISRYTFGFVLALLAAYAGMLIFLWKKETAPEWKFLYLGAVFGLIYLFALPAYSAPDEAAHAYTAYYQSSRLLGQEALDENGYVLVRAEDRAYVKWQNSANIGSYEQVYNHFFSMSQDNTMVSTKRVPLDVPGYVYLPQIVGLTVGRLLNLGNIPMLFLARLLGLAFYLGCVWLSIRVAPFGKGIFMVTALLPIALENGASFSYDGMVNGLSFLFIACVLHLAYRKEKIGIRDWAVLSVLLALLAPIKVVYVLLGFLCLLIPAKKLPKKRTLFIGTAVVLAAGAVAILIPRASYLLNVVTRESNSLSYTTAEGYTVGYFLQEPTEFIKIYLNSFVESQDFYLQTMLGGSLAWLDLPLTWTLLFGFGALLLYASIQKDGEEQYLGLKEKSICGVTAVAVCCACMLTMLLAWTSKSSDTIAGVQGRYFLPVLPLILLMLRSKNLVTKGKEDRVLMVGLFFLQHFSVLQILTVVSGR